MVSLTLLRPDKPTGALAFGGGIGGVIVACDQIEKAISHHIDSPLHVIRYTARSGCREGLLSIAIRVFRDISVLFDIPDDSIVHLVADSGLGQYRLLIQLVILKCQRRHVVVDFRGNYKLAFPEKDCHSLFAYVQKACIYLADRFLVQCGDYSEIGYGFRETVRRTFNYIQCSPLNPKLLEFPNKARILFVGSITVEKGVDLLLQSYERIKLYYPMVSLTLIGSVSEEMRKPVDRLIRTDPHIRVLGVLDHSQVQRVMADCDIFVYPSTFTKEGQSNAVTEALAHGLPVITYSSVADKFSIPSESFVLVQRPSLDSISQAIFDVLRNPLRAKEVSRLTHDLICKQYSLTAYINNLLSVYNSLLTKSDALHLRNR